MDDTKICNSEECGKYVVSKRFFKAGESIVVGKPYSVITSQQYKNLACNTCLKALQKEKIPCKCNQVWYCSSECQYDHNEPSVIHTDLECSAIKNINNSQFKLFPNELTEVRLALRVICHKIREQTDTSVHTTVKYDDIRKLVINKNVIIQRPEVYERVLIKQKLISKAMNKLYTVSEDEIQDIICIIMCNAFGIWSKKLENQRALGLYPNCSYFNHSCMPTCVRVQRDLNLTIKTLFDIPENTELTISYVEVEDNYTARQNILNNYYYFNCKCSRCLSKDDDIIQDPLIRLLCPTKGCAGIMAVLNPTIPTKRECNACGTIKEFT